MTRQEQKILKQLIRNRFDKCGIITEINEIHTLISIAHSQGFLLLEAEMQNDLIFELQKD